VDRVAHPTRKKTICGTCGTPHHGWYDRRQRRIRDLPCGNLRIYLEFDLRRVDCRRCGGVKQERLDWLAANPHYTKRFALYVGKQCRSASVKEVAHDLWLDWDAVKEMDKLYMREQLARAGEPRPAVIGIDELSIRKGHVYRIIVSDLERERPIWFGGVDRSEASMAMFYDFLGTPRSTGVRLAVMDMWKPFRNATAAHAPQAAILYDKFHVLRQLNEAMDKVRKAEYQRLTNRADRKYIKGQKYVLLSHRENLSPEKRQRLQTLLAANKRLNTAYVLKEQFGQLWSYRREPWARKFFEQWRAALRWQRLKPFETFAQLIDRHWDGITAYCEPENKVALGFVEGLNNKIRVIQRRCYGLRDEDYLHLKILTCTLPPLPRT
jgi:transposase